MENPSSQEPNGLEGPLRERSASIMRSFLDSREELVWPDEFGEVGPERYHCRFDNNIFPFKRVRRIFKGKCDIDCWVVDSDKAPTFPFKELFVTKMLQRQHVSTTTDSRTKREISVMKDLRHPHIVVFLGTWERFNRLSILMFPAACCDLGDFMKRISDDLEDLRASALGPVDLSDLDSSTASPGSLSGPPTSSRPVIEYSCPQKLRLVRKYFVCLSQALRYIQEQGVRHKDIKPKNILIDESGSVLLSDFGLSKISPFCTSHVTHEHQNYDPKYVSPEMFNNRPGGDLSDVFSLGCVFLEMATILQGKTLKDLDNQYLPKTSDPEIEVGGYHANLEAVYEWLRILEASGRNGATETKGDDRSTNGGLTHQNLMSEGDLWVQGLKAALASIQNMMAEDPAHRPKASELWSHFQDIAPELCSDCDPRHEDVWKPKTAT